MEINQLTKAIIGSAIEVHRALGPGLEVGAQHAALGRSMLRPYFASRR